MPFFLDKFNVKVFLIKGKYFWKKRNNSVFLLIFLKKFVFDQKSSKLSAKLVYLFTGNLSGKAKVFISGTAENHIVSVC